MRALTRALSATLLLAGGAAQADDAQEWELLLDERRHSVFFSGGSGEEPSWGAGLVLMLPLAAELSADYQRNELTEPFDQLSLQLGSDSNATWSAYLGYATSGNSASLESRDLSLGVQYYPGNWRTSARYLTGDVVLRTSPESERIESRRVSTDRAGWEVTADAFLGRWTASVSAIDYQYDRDIDINPLSLRARQALGANSFNQLLGLIDWYASSQISLQHQRHQLSLGYARFELEATDETGASPYLGWNIELSDHFSASLLAAVGQQAAGDYGEVALRYFF